jgi:hypothetical protein
MRRLSQLPWPLLAPFLVLCGMVALLRFTHAEKEPSLPPLGAEQRSALTEGQQHLLQAVESSDWRTTAELLREGADPNLRRPVALPLGNKPDKELQGRYRGDPLLKIAVSARDESIVRLLLKHGADVNATGRFGYTPLMGAANLNDPKLVKLLLEHKADPNATGMPDEQSALHIVLSYEHYWKPDQLAPSYRTKEEQKQLENLARPVLERRIAIVKLLLAAGADPTQKDSKGQTPADYARKRGNQELVKLLSTPKFTRNATLTKGAGR